MKSLMRLLECVLADASTWCSTSTTRDLNRIARRVEHEGVSFLTMTLPAFASDFERSLELGRIDTSLFLGFKKRGALPELLRGLLCQVFDASTGNLLKDESHLAIHAVRQICMMFKKVLLPCSDERERKAYDSFIETDRSVAEFEASLEPHWTSMPDGYQAAENSLADGLGEYPSSRDSIDRSAHYRQYDRLGDKCPPQLGHFKQVSGVLWASLFDIDSFRVDFDRVIPRHGPGATAERLAANARYSQREWHERLDLWFPASDFLVPNSGFVDQLADIQMVSPDDERPVRVVTVPKTLKSPRIIAIEPACVQYTQQSIMEILVERLENHKFSKRHVNFTDQTVNQKLALKSSHDRSLATIDLKDASDRVSARLVWEMLETQRTFRSMVFSCRSLRADVPGYGIHSLSRFASMGSALCFPIEAMVFYTIVVSAIHRAEGYPLTPHFLLKARRGVRVYGDDIIVPVEYVQVVKRELEWFNLRVNSNKSFWTGKFRESCGLDAYDGTQVTPVYIRRLLPTSHRNTEELVSAVSLANQFYKNGYWRSASYVRSLVGRLANVPHVMENSSVLGWHSYITMYEAQAWCKTLHRWLVKGHVIGTKLRQDPLEGHGALMKFFLKRGRDPYLDEKHLERYGRPLSVYTKIRWAQPY
nr:MAG: hypothetical protein 3 [Leviviridae sp.]